MSNQIQKVFEQNEGIFRLAPVFVPRLFSQPGHRLKLHPDDYFALGTKRGAIKERWFSSVITANNGPLAAPDEGMSYVAPTDDPADKFSLKDAVQELGAKAVVIACNTATGMAVDGLREQYPELPIIGVEPAVKPAAEQYPGGRILVMATPMCLAGERFRELHARFSGDAEIIPVPCGGLMEFVERGELDGPVLRAYLREKLEPWLERPVDAVVLGCTHYPFLRKSIDSVLGGRAAILDGNAGITAQLHRRLREQGLLNPSQTEGTVTFYNSLEDPDILERSRILLHLPE